MNSGNTLILYPALRIKKIPLGVLAHLRGTDGQAEGIRLVPTVLSIPVPIAAASRVYMILSLPVVAWRTAGTVIRRLSRITSPATVTRLASVPKVTATQWKACSEMPIAAVQVRFPRWSRMMAS